MSVFFRRQSFALVTIDKSKDCFLVASASTKTTAERQQRLHCGYSPVRIDGPQLGAAPPVADIAA